MPPVFVFSLQVLIYWITTTCIVKITQEILSILSPAKIKDILHENLNPNDQIQIRVLPTESLVY